MIQVAGSLDDPTWRGRTIVDTWPNLRIADDAVARAHFEATLDVLLRPDGSTFHAARFADDGTLLERGTINGAHDDSTWARGQAWAILGLGGCGYRAEAERAARWFLDRLPADGIPPWDFSADHPKDASAAAIAASALFELGWDDDAHRLLAALEPCLNRGDTDGILLHCAYRPKQNVGTDCAISLGRLLPPRRAAARLLISTAPDSGVGSRERKEPDNGQPHRPRSSATSSPQFPPRTSAPSTVTTSLPCSSTSPPTRR